MVNPVLEILHIVPKFALGQIIARGGSLDVELLKLGEVAIEFALVVTPLIAGVCSNPTPKLFGERVVPIAWPPSGIFSRLGEFDCDY